MGDKTTTLWAPECTLLWASLRASGAPMTVTDDLGERFIPVFTSKEEAQRHYPDRPLFSMTIEEVPHG